jgi:hypothetical protein
LRRIKVSKEFATPHQPGPAAGGATWTSELDPVTSGPVFLSRDENLLTIITGANIMTLLHNTGK